MDWILGSEYGDIFQKVVIGYAVFAVVVPLFPTYREGVRGYLQGVKEEFGIYCLLTTAYGLSVWAWVTSTSINIVDHSTWFFESGALTALIGLLLVPFVIYGVFVTVVLGLTSVIWVPILLLLLPGLVVLFASFLLKGVFVGMLFVAKIPFLAWHHLHYLLVPHPAETAYRAGMTRQVPLPELAATVANVIYQFDLKDYDRLPKAWKSKNWQRRLDAFQGRLEAEDRFMEELIKNLELKAHFRE